MVPFFRRLYERFLKIRGNPREIARGFALGLFIGFSPTMGFQIVVAVFLAAVLKCNKFAAAVGVQVTNPLTAPFVYSVTYVIGAKLIGLEKAFVWRDLFTPTKIVALIETAPRIILALTIGGVVVGIPVTVAGYFFSYRALAAYQDRIKAALRLQKDKLRQKVRGRKKAKRRKRVNDHP